MVDMDNGYHEVAYTFRPIKALLITLTINHIVLPTVMAAYFKCRHIHSDGTITDMCQPHGKCVVTNTIERCHCSSLRYCGNLCQWQSPCRPGICFNQGTCRCGFQGRNHSYAPTAKCLCFAEFSGPSCEELSDENPCKKYTPCPPDTVCTSKIVWLTDDTRSRSRKIRAYCNEGDVVRASYVYSLLSKAEVKIRNMSVKRVTVFVIPVAEHYATKAKRPRLDYTTSKIINQEIQETIDTRMFKGQMRFTYDEEDESANHTFQRLKALKDHTYITLQTTIRDELSIVNQFISNIKATREDSDSERRRRSLGGRKLNGIQRAERQVNPGESVTSTVILGYTLQIGSEEISGRDFAAELTDSIKNNSAKFNVAGQFTLDTDSVLVAEAEFQDSEETKLGVASSNVIYSIFGAVVTLLILVILFLFVLRRKGTRPRPTSISNYNTRKYRWTQGNTENYPF